VKQMTTEELARSTYATFSRTGAVAVDVAAFMAKGHPYKDRPKAETHTWLTPPGIIDALGPFDLDPCAAPSPRPWPTASRHIELPEDGLAADWSGRVWCNPPFGYHTKAWLRRMAEHQNGIALAFARTDTAMFHESVFPRAHGALFVAGRPSFHYPDGTKAKGNSGGPIVLIAYGKTNEDALNRSGIAGTYLRFQEPSA